MTTTLSDGTAVRAADERSALARCLGVPAGEFAREIWGRRALLSPRESLPGGFDDLFSVAAVDELVSERGLRTPFLRMAKAGDVLPASRFTAPGGAGAEIADQVSSEKVLREFADGATIVLQGLHRTWAPIGAFTRRLAHELGSPVQVNAYVTPASNRGFDPHYDVHDVFVLQIAGEKRWVVHEPVREAPLADEPWADRAAEVGARAAEEPAIDTLLRPGDALYLPRGWLHSATALGGTTVHLTVGTPAYTGTDLARELLADLVRDDELRRSLPLGVDVADPGQVEPVMRRIIERLTERLQQPDPADARRLAAVLGARFQRATGAAPVSPLATVELADRLDPDARIRLRDGLAARVRVEGDVVRLLLPGRGLTLPAVASGALEALVAGRTLAAGALPGLDEADGLVVARRLLREAVVVPSA